MCVLSRVLAVCVVHLWVHRALHAWCCWRAAFVRAVHAAPVHSVPGTNRSLPVLVLAHRPPPSPGALLSLCVQDKKQMLAKCKA